MAHIFIKEEEFKRLRKLPEIVDVPGSYGKCYLINPKTLIKIFSEESQGDILYSGYKSDCISFPDTTFYTDDITKVKAYTMRYFKGASVYRWGLPQDLEIDRFWSAYNTLLEEIERFPEIFMFGLESYNILFDWCLKRFYLIDTDLWQLKENAKEKNEDLLAFNMMNVMQRRILKWYFHPLNKDKNLYELTTEFVSRHDTRLVFPQFMKELQDKVENEVGKVKTLGELKLAKK